MTLIACPECRAQISDQAAVCPSCGKAKQKKGPGFLKVVLLGFFGLVVLSSIAAINHSGSASRKPTPAESAETTLETLRYAAVLQAKEAVLAILKDPESATFKDVVAYTKKGQVNIVCGYVNAKNSFGGFMGNTEFVSLLGIAQLYDGHNKDFRRMWNRDCKNG